jgi:hypothetical protein
MASLVAGGLRADCLYDLELCDADRAGIERAIADVEQASFAEFAEVAVYAALRFAGPHHHDAPSNVAHALRMAPTCRPLAEAVVDRFADALVADMVRPQQQWWNLWTPESCTSSPLGVRSPASWAWFTAPDNWFFTINPAPSSLHEAFGLAWDASSEHLSRWSVQVDPAARIFEVRRPDDWAALVQAHPCETRTGRYEGWEINGKDRHRVADEFDNLPAQRAARSGVRRFLEPDWTSVADEWDGVHLSWAGFLTTEGTATDLGAGEVTMLRGWGSERTVWLNPVLQNPLPVDPNPADALGRFRDDDSGSAVVDLRADPERCSSDLAFLRRKFAGTAVTP